MDSLDIALVEAWDRIGDAVRAERVRALKRSRRRFRSILQHPMRETCLVIRASDTRINDFSAIIDPKDAYDAREAHTLTIEGELIREITKPVSIPWPGVTYREAANICGRDYMTIAGWAKRGVFTVDRYHEYAFPPGGKRGRRPRVWTPSPIDVNSPAGVPPHRVWGTLWQGQWEKMPENYILTVERVPRWRVFRGRVCFRGWRFLCPGRLNERDEYTGCGRSCTYLYAPQTLWTLGKAIDDLSGFDMPEDSGLAGQWVPGLHDASAMTGPKSFACKECWKVRSTWMAHHDGWNQFITHISGGLLYGRDVPRPPDYPLQQKKRACGPRRKTLAREETHELRDERERQRRARSA